MNRRQRGNSIKTPFVPHLAEMVESPAWRTLSLSAHRLLSRIEAEHCHHGGYDNGQLPVTFGDLVKYGIARNRIGLAIREATALGFIEIVEHGRAGVDGYGRSNRFRLTYLPTREGRSWVEATHEWRRLKNTADAVAAADRARGEAMGTAWRPAKKKFSRRNRTVSVRKPNRKPENSVAESEPLCRGSETEPLSRSGGGGGGSRRNSTASKPRILKVIDGGSS